MWFVSLLLTVAAFYGGMRFERWQKEAKRVARKRAQVRKRREQCAHETQNRLHELVERLEPIYDRLDVSLDDDLHQNLMKVRVADLAIPDDLLNLVAFVRVRIVDKETDTAPPIEASISEEYARAFSDSDRDLRAMISWLSGAVIGYAEGKARRPANK